MNLPKHIQEAATPLTDAKEHWHTFEDGFHSIDPVPEKHKSLGTHVPIDHARNLERITIWQQEVMEKIVKRIKSQVPCGKHSGMPGDVACGDWGTLCKSCENQLKSLDDYTQLQSYLKTLKGEK